MVCESLLLDLMQPYMHRDIIFKSKISVNILSSRFSILVEGNQIQNKYLRFPKRRIDDPSNLYDRVENVSLGKSTEKIKPIVMIISRISKQKGEYYSPLRNLCILFFLQSYRNSFCPETVHAYVTGNSIFLFDKS